MGVMIQQSYWLDGMPHAWLGWEADAMFRMLTKACVAWSGAEHWKTEPRLDLSSQCSGAVAVQLDQHHDH